MNATRETKKAWPRRNRRGAVLFLVAAGLVVLLGVMALAIDLGMMYVARNEAQRASDAAALSGAEAFVTSGCLAAGCSAGGPQEPQARAQAQLLGAQNSVLGRPATIAGNQISFSYPSPQEPQITVAVSATVPTIFARILGVRTVPVSVTSMAEAYNGSTVFGCVAPFLVPDCDPNHPAGAVNTMCANDNGPYAASHFINTTTDPPTLQPGVLGETWQLHFGQDASHSVGPSQWYLLGFANNSGSALRDAIVHCSPIPLACGDWIDTANGKKVGPVDQGVEERIHANGLGPGQGQDTLNSVSPLQMTGGANNPYGLAGKTFTGSSDSIVLVPVYNGGPVDPGGSRVQIVGFLQLFITDVEQVGSLNPVNTVILGAALCNGTVVTNPSATIPVRLIHP
ncbi:MAG TPA: TadE/TadG family type IV pilus assembly protein [Candidatus Acidoferrales bacterium]|nr:TadE/TadG family type IV pilus assembly protein [Candidatus Acidoferrales bacterium]